MITLSIFCILMFMVFGKLIWWAIQATWCITKVLFSFIFLPLVLIGLAFSGLFAIAIPILIVVGIIALIGSAAA